MIEISDIQVAIVAIMAITSSLALVSHLAGVSTDGMITGLAGTAIAAISGMAGYNVGKRA